MEDLTCPACKAVNDGEARYCDQCAQRLVPSDDAPNDDACPACGGKVEERGERLVCTGCELEFTRAEEAEPVVVKASEAAAATALVPCPLCGEPTRDDAPTCGACGLWFDTPRKPVPCPRCGKPAGPDDCSCGAIITLDKLLQFVEPAVRFVCKKCKSPYGKLPDATSTKCPSCGGQVLSAERLKTYARSLQG
jgi:predicted amidophosphoribosyltransferase